MKVKYENEWKSINHQSLGDFKNMGINEFYLCDGEFNTFFRKNLHNSNSIKVEIKQDYNELTCFYIKLLD